ncbi:5-dehydro-2-deoxygluconokinase [Micromonospora olivasterospora]|uniref:5-dehydro-2-deoxygluconokinase n=1 Tax=Micromonospora olivasterospora TaxID=1880 RepID=UPI001FEC0808|nr:5-dehydro-2-deoxygluconokinase [Micromonospora olivasterospora]
MRLAIVPECKDKHVDQYDVVTVGRIGVDLYPEQSGVGLDEVETFRKFLGGSATNVAVAAARLGNRAAVVTGVGGDPFGSFAVRALERFGVATEFVKTVPDLATPITFCELFPPDDFPLYFYRAPVAPDLMIGEDDLDRAAISEARLLWLTASGLSREPSRSAHHAIARARRDRPGLTVLDLDYRPTFWPSPDEAAARIAELLPYVDVALGNAQECAVAVGPGSPDELAARLHERGVELAIVKQGPDGVLGSRAGDVVHVAVTPVAVVNGLGAGDAFGGVVCHGLLHDWELAEMLEIAGRAGAHVVGRLGCADEMPVLADLLAPTPEA